MGLNGKEYQTAAMDFSGNRDGKAVAPFAHPVYVMAKPIGALCNMACDYCYYAEKADAYGYAKRMDGETLELLTKQCIEMQTQREVLFTWHGGEPLLRHIDFYKRAIELQWKYADGHLIDNCIQTNGTLIDDEWARFFSQNGWLVGVSIDGDEALHDKYRRTAGGRPTFGDVMRGIRTLNKYGVEWNAMAVVNSYNADRPSQFYHFLKSIGCRYIQFTPIVERKRHGRLASTDDDSADCEPTAESLSPERWGRFLCALFDEWVGGDIGECFIQLFEATLANMMGVEPGVCSMSRSCGNSLVVEYNGDVYPCDHFVFPKHRLGNIHERPLAEMAYGERQNTFRRKKMALPRRCLECQWLDLCNGECPKNRTAPDGGNCLCDGYRMFFEHAQPYLKILMENVAVR